MLNCYDQASFDRGKENNMRLYRKITYSQKERTHLLQGEVHTSFGKADRLNNKTGG